MTFMLILINLAKENHILQRTWHRTGFSFTCLGQAACLVWSNTALKSSQECIGIPTQVQLHRDLLFRFQNLTFHLNNLMVEFSINIDSHAYVCSCLRELKSKLDAFFCLKFLGQTYSHLICLWLRYPYGWVLEADCYHKRPHTQQIYILLHSMGFRIDKCSI